MSFTMEIISTMILSFTVAYIVTYAGMSIYAYLKYRKMYKEIMKEFDVTEEVMKEAREQIEETREQMKQMRTKKPENKWKK